MALMRKALMSDDVRMKQGWMNTGEKVRISASKTAVRSMKIMISPSVSKVNNPPHLADFAARRDCSAVEAAPTA
jgi:hypothetical protein